MEVVIHIVFYRCLRYTRGKRGPKARVPIPPDILKAAVDRAVNGEALHSIAKEYGLSHNTLWRYTRKLQRGESTTLSSSYNVKQVFTAEEEAELAKYLDIMAQMNHGLTTNLIDNLANDLAVKKGKSYPKVWDKDKKAGYFWRRGFLNRNPSLSLKNPEPIKSN